MIKEEAFCLTIIISMSGENKRRDVYERAKQYYVQSGTVTFLSPTHHNQTGVFNRSIINLIGQLINILSTWRKCGGVVWKRFPALRNRKLVVSQVRKAEGEKKSKKSICRRPDGMR